MPPRACFAPVPCRSVGDKDFKGTGTWEGPSWLPYPDDHPRTFTGPLVVAEPEVRSARAGRGDTVVVFCDGVSDVLDVEEVAEVVRDGADAARLCELAVQLGSGDNCSAVVYRIV